MKAAILLICSIAIFQTQADVQENDISEICKQCKGSALPTCERADHARLGKTIECKQAGCIIAMAADAESDYMCLKADESSEVTIPESKDDSPQSTILPLPLPLQMITTTENSKDDPQVADNPADTVEVSGGEEIDSDGAGPQAEKSRPVKVASEETEMKKEQEQSTEEKSAEREDESKPVETAIQPAQTSNSDTSESESAAAAAEESKPESVNPPNSPDYPADEPAMHATKTNADTEQHTVPAGEQHQTVENEPGKGHNTVELTDQHNASRNSGAVHPTLETEKGKELASNGDQGEMNGGGNNVTEHTDNSAQGSDGPAEMQVEANSVGATNVLNTEPTAVVISSSAPATTTAVGFLVCYSCTSTTDARCVVGLGMAVNCQANNNKQNGCYTLYKADTNITTRGCISELTDDGLKYCMSNSKQCILCYEKACNNLVMRSDAIKSNAKLSFLLGIASFMVFRFLL